MKVKFYDTIADEKLEFAVIVSRYQNKWVYCKHKERTTFEVPGGHREPGESIGDTAKRELYEETGAKRFTLKQISVYSTVTEESERFGMLFFAEIEAFDALPDMEIGEVHFFEDLPEHLTYPLIQPYLISKIAVSLNEED